MNCRSAVVVVAALALLVPAAAVSSTAGWRKEVSRSARLPIASDYAMGFRLSLSRKWYCNWLPHTKHHVYACAGRSRGIVIYLLLTHPSACRYRSYTVALNTIVSRHNIPVKECR